VRECAAAWRLVAIMKDCVRDFEWQGCHFLARDSVRSTPISSSRATAADSDALFVNGKRVRNLGYCPPVSYGGGHLVSTKSSRLGRRELTGIARSADVPAHARVSRPSSHYDSRMLCKMVRRVVSLDGGVPDV